MLDNLYISLHNKTNKQSNKKHNKTNKQSNKKHNKTKQKQKPKTKNDFVAQNQVKTMHLNSNNFISEMVWEIKRKFKIVMRETESQDLNYSEVPMDMMTGSMKRIVTL